MSNVWRKHQHLIGEQEKSSDTDLNPSLHYHANASFPLIIKWITVVTTMRDVMISEVNKAVYLEYAGLGVNIM